MAPLKNVGPKLIVIEANQIMKAPKRTHWGESIKSPIVRKSESSGVTGASFNTIVKRLIVETVTKRRNVVSKRLHLGSFSQLRMEFPMGRSKADRPQSTIP